MYAIAFLVEGVSVAVADFRRARRAGAHVARDAGWFASSSSASRVQSVGCREAGAQAGGAWFRRRHPAVRSARLIGVRLLVLPAVLVGIRRRRLSGHFASGRYAAHASAIPASAVFVLTSISAIRESPSAASIIVAAPFTMTDHSAGAMNVLPATVVRGVSTASRSATAAGEEIDVTGATGGGRSAGFVGFAVATGGLSSNWGARGAGLDEPHATTTTTRPAASALMARAYSTLAYVACDVTSLLTADDLFLFNQGTHYRLYQKLGAHVVDGGTQFAVWAPNAHAGQRDR